MFILTLYRCDVDQVWFWCDITMVYIILPFGIHNKWLRLCQKEEPATDRQIKVCGEMGELSG